MSYASVKQELQRISGSRNRHYPAPERHHVIAERLGVAVAAADPGTLAAVTGFEAVDHEVAVDQIRVRRSLDRMDERTVVGEIGGGRGRRDRGIGHVNDIR